jgi:hypothetical protein
MDGKEIVGFQKVYIFHFQVINNEYSKLLITKLLYLTSWILASGSSIALFFDFPKDPEKESTLCKDFRNFDY